MKRIRYSKYVPDPAGESAWKTCRRALDFLLQSGFENYMYYDPPEASRHSTICAAPSDSAAGRRSAG